MSAPYAEVDVDGIIAWCRWRDARIDAAIKAAYDYCAGLNSIITRIPPFDLTFLDLPADSCDPHVGAGFTAPVSFSAPGAPHETRN